MSKSIGLFRKGLLVTLTVMVLMVVAFFMYSALFVIFESIFPGDYAYVSMLRVGFGFVWLLGALLLDQTRFPEWLKAGIFSEAMAIFMITLTVTFYENPTVRIVAMLFTVAISIVYFVLRKKEWFYFYGVFLALLAVGSYL